MMKRSQSAKTRKGITVREISEILSTVAKNGITELEIADGNVCLHITARNTTPDSQKKPPIPRKPAVAISSPDIGYVTFTVAVNDCVKAGAVLGNVMMVGLGNTDISFKSPFPGIITELLVENHEAVEYGQKLLLIKPTT